MRLKIFSFKIHFQLVICLPHKVELNIKYYGYGVKGFILSLIETTLKQFDKKIEVEVIEEILDIGKKMLIEPVKILPNVITTLEYLSKNHILILITKGDLYDQEKKIANSNLSKYFDFLEIISNKTEDEYIKILSKYNVNPKNFLMVGNSLKSDILPVNNLGGTGIYIPSNLTWDHEKIKIEEIPENLITLKNISMLIPYLNNEFPN